MTTAAASTAVAATPSPPPAAPPPIPLAKSAEPPLWPRSAQLAAVVILVIVTSLVGWNIYGSNRRATRPVDLDAGSLAFRIDLNHADHAHLLQLPGVGEALARHIEDYRDEHYGFRSVDELKQVHGIGPAVLEKLRHLVYVDAATGADDGESRSASGTKKAGPRKPETDGKNASAAKKQDAITSPIDVNQAPSEELQRLPGVGPTLASRIIEARKNKPFKSVDDLRRVAGIGQKTLEKVRAFVRVGEGMHDPAKE